MIHKVNPFMRNIRDRINPSIPKIFRRNHSLLNRFRWDFKYNGNRIDVCDVTLRDGIQSLNPIPIENKMEIFRWIRSFGIRNIEVGSHVSSKIKSMANTFEFLKRIAEERELYNQTYDFSYNDYPMNLRVLVPNYNKTMESYPLYNDGMFDMFSLITASSESFTMKNMKMTIDDSIGEMMKIANLDENPNLRKPNIRIYISSVFGCPFEGYTYDNTSRVKQIVNIFENYPCVKEIVLSDSNGSFDSDSSIKILDEIMKHVSQPQKIWGHFHVKNGNLREILDICMIRGITRFDISLGNVGGCVNITNKKDIHPNVSMPDFFHTIINHNDVERSLNSKYMDIDKMYQIDMYVRDYLKNYAPEK